MPTIPIRKMKSFDSESNVDTGNAMAMPINKLR
jgi:hypothetical protein